MLLEHVANNQMALFRSTLTPAAFNSFASWRGEAATPRR
jgi:hypothetical protein